MANYELISKDGISTSEALSIIEKKAEKRELAYREEKSLEYLKKFNKMNFSTFEKAKKEIEELQIPRLESQHIIKILDIMPKSGTELRSIVSHSGTVLVDDSVTKILDVLKKYKN